MYYEHLICLNDFRLRNCMVFVYNKYCSVTVRIKLPDYMKKHKTKIGAELSRRKTYLGAIDIRIIDEKEISVALYPLFMKEISTRKLTKEQKEEILKRAKIVYGSYRFIRENIKMKQV